MNTTSMPETLRRAVANDLKPVRPLPPLWRRSLAVGIVSLAVFAAALVAHGLRPDLLRLSVWIGWGATLLEALVGLALVSLALRESVPGLALGRSAIAAAVGIGIATDILIAFLTRSMVTARMTPGTNFLCGMTCSRNELVIGLPAFLFTLYLVARALPLRPGVVGLLGGLGSGLVADGINHLLCPMSSLRHVLVWHTGAILVLMAVGWCCGTAWGALRDKKAATTRP